MTNLERLKRLAHVVRLAFEGIYGRNSDLGGACFDSSRQLFRLAKENGIETEIGIGSGHAFILLGDTVVDVTATQFGKRRKVVVAKLATLENQVDKGWSGCNPWRLRSRHASIRSANAAWGGECCGRTYRQERRAVLKAFDKGH